jgi:hypothetical protein
MRIIKKFLQAVKKISPHPTVFCLDQKYICFPVAIVEKTTAITKLTLEVFKKEINEIDDTHPFSKTVRAVLNNHETLEIEDTHYCVDNDGPLTQLYRVKGSAKVKIIPLDRRFKEAIEESFVDKYKGWFFKAKNRQLPLVGIKGKLPGQYRKDLFFLAVGRSAYTEKKQLQTKRDIEKLTVQLSLQAKGGL